MRYKTLLGRILCTIVALSLGQSGLSSLAGDYDKGVELYKRKSYAKAAQYFGSAATRHTAEAPKALFYLGLIQAKMKEYDAAKTTFETLLKSVPSNASLAKKARNNLAYITKQQLSQNSHGANAQKLTNIVLNNGDDNYLAHVINNGQVVHWDVRKMPLKVYIHPARNVAGWWSSSLNTHIVGALNTWQAASSNKIRFQFVKNPAQANIQVHWVQKMQHNRIGENPFQAVGRYIVKSDVKLATQAPNGTALDSRSLRRTAIHEFGHVLGIQGHSPYPEDVMYYASNAGSGTRLTSRDKATLRSLYQLDADIGKHRPLTAAQAKTLKPQ